MTSNHRDALVKRINNKLAKSGRKLKSVRGIGQIYNIQSGVTEETAVNIEELGSKLGVMKTAAPVVAFDKSLPTLEHTAAPTEQPAALVAAVKKTKKSAAKQKKAAVKKNRKPRKDAIQPGEKFGDWIVVKDVKHSRFACKCSKCGRKKTIFSGTLRGTYKKQELPNCAHEKK